MPHGPTPQTGMRDLSAGVTAPREAADSLATAALGVIARRHARHGPKPDPAHLDLLGRALGDARRATRDAAVTALVRAGIDRAALADHYVPALARQLGDDWVADRLSFADVTIRSARLQSLLRELGEPWSQDCAEASGEGVVAVLVAPGEDHTLGALVMTGQLRRLGVSVRVVLSRSADEALAQLARRRYAAIMISSANTDRVDRLAAFVGALRPRLVAPCPICVGGPVLSARADVAAVTGADHATSDVRLAAALCGLVDPGAEAAP